MGGVQTTLAQNRPEIAPLDRFQPAIQPFTIVYAPDQIEFDDTVRAKLRMLARRLDGNQDGIKIIVHSGAAQIPTNEAVTLSLRRALEIRNYLVKLGVTPAQIDAEALAQAEDSGPKDRAVISAR